MTKSLFIRLILFTVSVFGLSNSSTAQLSSKDSLLQASRKLTVEIPSAVGFVNDFEQLFSATEIDSLTRLIVRLNTELDIQLAIVTLDSTYTNANDFDAFSLILAKEWGVGEAKKDNGILIAVSKSLRKMRINNGYGIERFLSDQETAEIVNRHCIPNFKTDDFFKGTTAGIEEIKVKILKNK
jgi:uncharacterized protein